MHAAAYEFVGLQVAAHGPFLYVIEIGSRNINGSVRPLFGPTKYIGIDTLPGRDVDVVADGATWQAPFKAYVDCVVCCEVLEHTGKAREIVANMREILGANGWLIITCGGLGRMPHSAVDGGPLRADEYYCNVTREEVVVWLDGMDDVEVTYRRDTCDLYAVARKR